MILKIFKIPENPFENISSWKNLFDFGPNDKVMKTNLRNIFRITNVTDWKTKVTWKTLFVQ